jgi:hypothetical protein
LAIVLGPYAEDVLATPDAQHHTADSLTCVHELIANQSHEEFLPVAVGDPFLEPHDPLAAFFILLVLPDRPYAMFEDVVVTNRGQTRRSLEVGEDFPEFLGCAELEHRLYRFFIIAAFGCGWPKPHNPCAFERPWHLEIELSRGAHHVFGDRRGYRFFARAVDYFPCRPVLLVGGRGGSGGGRSGRGARLEVKRGARGFGRLSRRTKRCECAGPKSKRRGAPSCRRGQTARRQWSDAVEGIAAAVRRVATKSFRGGEGALVIVGLVVLLFRMRHGQGELTSAGALLVLGPHRRGAERTYLERRVQRFSLLSIGSQVKKDENGCKRNTLRGAWWDK